MFLKFFVFNRFYSNIVNMLNPIFTAFLTPFYDERMYIFFIYFF